MTNAADQMLDALTTALVNIEPSMLTVPPWELEESGYDDDGSAWVEMTIRRQPYTLKLSPRREGA